MSKPKISVATPIYNCEKYIHQCVKSLMEQTYDNIEYIFINDASTDDSLAVLKNTISLYPHRHNQIIIIDLPTNKGVTNARRLAFNTMTGDYFTFCDGDDWIDKNAFTAMLAKATETSAEIICTPFFINSPKKEVIHYFKNTSFRSLNEIPLDVHHFSLCNKLIKTELLANSNIAFYEEVNYWEDLSIIARLLAITDKVTILNTPFYHYRKGSGKTLTNSCHKRILKEHIICAEKLCEWFKANNLHSKYQHFLLFLKFTAKIKMLRGREKNIAQWKSTFPETNAHISKFAHIPAHYKLMFHATNALPTRLTQFVANRLEIFYK